MKTAVCTACLVVLAFPAIPQALAPELAPLATKYKTDIAALGTQRATALSQAQNPYVAALATAEKSATASGNVAGVAVITAERAALKSGLLAPGFPPGMPKELQNPRKTYLESLTRIRTAEAPRRQALDAAYLRALTNLSAKAPKESELAKQIDAEKQKLLASAPATGGSKTSSKSAVVNGTFDVGDSSTASPGGWLLGEGFKAVRDGTNNILHASVKVPGYVVTTQDILLPPRARSVTLSGRVRGKIVLRDPAKSQGSPGVFVSGQFFDKNDSGTPNWIMNDGGSDMQWKTVTSTTKIPDDMKTLQVGLVLKYVSGDFDFDDIEVEFR